MYKRNALEVTQEKRLYVVCYICVSECVAMEDPGIGTRRNTKEGKITRKMGGWSKTECG